MTDDRVLDVLALFKRGNVMQPVSHECDGDNRESANDNSRMRGPGSSCRHRLIMTMSVIGDADSDLRISSGNLCQHRWPDKGCASIREGSMNSYECFRRERVGDPVAVHIGLQVHSDKTVRIALLSRIQNDPLNDAAEFLP